MYLNYPTNPTATAAPDGVFDEAVAWAKRNDAWVMHDFAYGDLVFDGREPRSFLAADGARDVGIELFSMSKSYGMAGWRLGFALGNAELIRRIEKLQDHAFAGIFRPVQEAGIAALTGPQDSVEERRATYERRRDRALAALAGSRRAPRARSSSGSGCPTASRSNGSSRSIASRSRPARASAHAAPAGRDSRSPSPTRRSTAGSSAYGERCTNACSSARCSRSASAARERERFHERQSPRPDVPVEQRTGEDCALGGRKLADPADQRRDRVVAQRRRGMRRRRQDASRSCARSAHPGSAR